VESLECGAYRPSAAGRAEDRRTCSIEWRLVIPQTRLRSSAQLAKQGPWRNHQQYPAHSRCEKNPSNTIVLRGTRNPKKARRRGKHLHNRPGGQGYQSAAVSPSAISGCLACHLQWKQAFGAGDGYRSSLKPQSSGYCMSGQNSVVSSILPARSPLVPQRGSPLTAGSPPSHLSVLLLAVWSDCEYYGMR